MWSMKSIMEEINQREINLEKIFFMDFADNETAIET